MLSDNWRNFKAAWRRYHAWPVLYSAVIANLLTLNFGITLGYASPAIPELRTDNEVTSINDTSIVFSAMVPFGAMVSAPIAGWLLDTQGRHMALMFCAIPYTTGWLLIILTRLATGRAFLPILYIGRFFTGAGMGYATTSVPLYVAELAPYALRGLFVGMFGIMLASGVLLIQLCGVIHGATYYWLPVVPLSTIVVYVFVMAMLTKETPRWLQKTTRTKGARLVLLWLRGTNYDVDKEQLEITEQLSSEKRQSLFLKFKHKSAYYPLFLGVCLTCFRQLGGINVVIFYAEVIFSDVESISEYADVVSTICVGGSSVVGAIVLFLLIDKFGRRKLLLSGAVLMCLSCAIMGIYYIFNSKPYCNPDDASNECVDSLFLLPIISIITYSCGFASSWGTIPYLVAAELLPLHVRGAGVGIVSFGGWFSATVLLLAFEPYQETVNPWGAFFTFSLVMLCAFLFVLKFIPETKGKTLEEIQQNFFKSKAHTTTVAVPNNKTCLSNVDPPVIYLETTI
ncbi:solute carrier family 2, facilitated glucose transporter member 8-like [Dysidea avara]|uniref:solute carrier family 2, facilitated glucose transporter member 8-like n=1 Tax=Dysidea avara TaxID=196820 RepID=UPI0033307BD1